LEAVPPPPPRAVRRDQGGALSGLPYMFYRQLAKPISELWHQAMWVDEAGIRLDGSVTFGDGAGPSCPCAQFGVPRVTRAHAPRQAPSVAMLEKISSWR
jgi:hypothetical protein